MEILKVTNINIRTDNHHITVLAVNQRAIQKTLAKQVMIMNFNIGRRKGINCFEDTSLIYWLATSMIVIKEEKNILSSFTIHPSSHPHFHYPFYLLIFLKKGMPMSCFNVRRWREGKRKSTLLSCLNKSTIQK